MKTFSLLMLLFMLWTFWAIPGLADEKKDHVCFRVLDTDEDGRVTYAEFAKEYGDDKRKFTEADADNDGNLSHDEYHSFMGHGAS